MIGASMDFQTLSRKELQALCKSNGIPANKTNAFMMEALAKKRAPLSQVDANREQKVDRSITSAFKSPPPARKGNTIASSTDPVRNPPLFTNNFLRRGKRKDAPPSLESHHEEKPKVQSINATSGPRKPSIDLSKRPGASAAHVKNVPKVPSCFKSETVPAGIAMKEAKVATAGVSSSNDLAKEQIEERVRLQINAALCSRVTKLPESRPSTPTSKEFSERVPDALDFPLENPEQRTESCVSVKAESSEVVDLPPGRQEHEMGSLSSPDPPARQITNIDASLDLIVSPPLRISPFVRQVEEKVLTIVDRIQSFWRSRDLPLVSSLGSPGQSTQNGNECVIFSTPSFVPRTDR